MASFVELLGFLDLTILKGFRARCPASLVFGPVSLVFEGKTLRLDAASLADQNAGHGDRP